MEVILPSRWDDKSIANVQWLASKLCRSVRIECIGKKLLIKGEMSEVESIISIFKKWR